jgi:hypothetical protein
MFKKTVPPQLDMFGDLSFHLSNRKNSILDDPTSWHNIFLREVTQRVDESVFEPLYKAGGRPNASLRVLLAMMILKEGNGWSDEQLFNSCRFDIRCMRALGLYHVGDDIPVESTYYEFRRRLTDHNKKEDSDLVAEAFSGVVRGQIEAFNLKGEKVRMDSKLIQSNIRKASRLDLILETVRVSITYLEPSDVANNLHDKDIALLELLKTKTTSNITYPLNGEEKKDMLLRLGNIIRHLLPFCKEGSLLHRLYSEQYHEEEDKGGDGKGPGKKIMLKEAKDTNSESLQSAHDPEAAFRRKGHGNSEQQVTGYHANVTETISDENKFQLITDVQTEAANICEDAFLQPAIKGSDSVLNGGVTGQKTINHVTTDGGYDSKANREIMAQDGSPHWNMDSHKGSKQRYELSRDEEGNLMAYCKWTKKNYKISRAKMVNKYLIIHEDGTKRYLTDEQVKNYFILQDQKAKQDPHDINLRPNVESTIHQVFHRLLKRNKMKYRGKYKCKMYCFSRAFWTNFTRILKNETEAAMFFLISMLWRSQEHEKSQKMVF